MTSFLRHDLNVVVDDNFYDDDTASELFQELKQLEFKTPSFRFNGNIIHPKRKHCGFGDDGMEYNFSGISVAAQPWTPLMLKLKADVEKICQCRFNFALVNMYQDGASKISHHRDDEKCLLPNQPIPTLSFGATRTLQFRRKDYPDVNISVKHGSLYIMHPPTNQLFTHAILEDELCMETRISVTFRHITSSRKRKMRDEDELPNNDWLTQHIRDMDTMKSNNFSLSENTFVTVKEFAHKFYVDFRRYQKSKKGPHVPTKEGVMLTAEQYFFFQDKIREFNFLYPDASTIASNMLLLNANNKLRLQQLISSPNNGITLKDNFIELYPFEVERLVEILQDINSCVLNSLWNDYFPLAFRRKCSEHQECDSSEMKKVFVDILEYHCVQIFKQIFKCNGCLVNSNSQLNHECTYTSNRSKLRQCDENALMLINFEQFISDLLDKNIFSSDFISNDIDYSNLKNELFSNEEEM